MRCIKALKQPYFITKIHLMKNERKIFKLVSRKEDLGNTGMHLYESSIPKEKIMKCIQLALFTDKEEGRNPKNTILLPQNSWVKTFTN